MAEQASTVAEIFTKPGCPYCRALRRKLERAGTAFVEHNVHGDPAALRRMLALNGGQRKVPTSAMGGQITVGFHGT
jgi:mycoredoxin